MEKICYKEIIINIKKRIKRIKKRKKQRIGEDMFFFIFVKLVYRYCLKTEKN